MVFKRKNNPDILPPAALLGASKSHIQQLLDEMHQADTLPALKQRFRHAFMEFGFVGYVCDRSVFEPLRDEDILSNAADDSHDMHSNARQAYRDMVQSFSLYNDICERLGHNGPGYAMALAEVGRSRLSDRAGVQLRDFIRHRRSPFMTIADTPQNHAPLLSSVFSVGVDFGQPAFADRLSVPLEAADGSVMFLCLFSYGKQTVNDIFAGIILAHAYHRLCRKRSQVARQARQMVPCVALGATQLECIKWAVAGKTIEDIAILTNLNACTVRYHLEQARRRYGYATIQQTLVRAAVDYQLDPLGPAHSAK